MGVKRKGLTPVIATTIMIGISVAAVGSYYTFQEEIFHSAEANLDFSVKDLTVESCWRKGSSTIFSVKNTGFNDVNTSRVEVYLKNQRIESSFGKNILKPGGVTTISIQKILSDQNSIRLISGQEETQEICSNPQKNIEIPNPVIEYSPSSPVSGETVNFDGSKSSDPDGSIVEYHWDFQNDSTFEKTGETVSWSYSSSGSKDVILKVKDSDGILSSTNKQVPIGVNSPPKAVFINNPSPPEAGSSVNFDGSKSSDSDGTVEKYQWDFDNDGNFEKSGTNVKTSFSSAGEKVVRLKATDNSGDSDTTSRSLKVQTINAISEKGGSLAAIKFISPSGTASIIPRDGKLCIGKKCSAPPGKCTSFDTQNCAIDVNKDSVEGGLKTEAVSMSGTPLCIGNNCGKMAGGSAKPNNQLNSTKSMDGPLNISNIVTDDSICIGKYC